jgi:DNA-binding IclR family transcriptional regulator
MNARGPAQSNQSLARGLACLQALVSAGGPVGSRALARELGLEHTRVSRLLGTLAMLGLAERTPAGRYLPGPGIHVLAAQSLQGSRLLAIALPHLRRLLRPGTSAALGVLWRKHVCYLFHGRSGLALEDGIGTTRPFPALQSSIGRALLAQQDQARVRALLAADPDPLPAAQLRDALRELAAVRAAGYAEVRSAPDHSTLGVIVGDPAVAGIALAGRITATDVPALRDALLMAAREITTALAQVRAGASRAEGAD